MDKKDTNPKDRAATTRLDLSLFPATARAYGALAMTEGDLKYGGYNYRTAGVKASVYYAACNRHLDKWFNGEWADPETGVPHLASALACLGVLIDAFECDKLNDDRPPKCDLAKTLSIAQLNVKELQSRFPDGPPRHTQKTSPAVRVGWKIERDKRTGPEDRRLVTTDITEVMYPYPWTKRGDPGRRLGVKGRRITDG